MFDKGAKTNVNVNKDFYNPHFYGNSAENTYTANLTPNRTPPQQITTRQFINPNTQI